MSFILDALKKSEIERQRQSMPGLVDSPAALRRGGLPLWAILLGALLAINVAVLSVVLMRNGAPKAAPARHDIAAVEQKPAADDHFSPLPKEPVYAPEIPLPPAEQSAPARAAVPPLLSSQPPAQRTTTHAVRHSDPVLVDEESKDDNEVLPSVN